MRQIFLLIFGLLGAGALGQTTVFLQQYKQNMVGEIRGLETGIVEIKRDRQPSQTALVRLEERRDNLTDQKARLDRAGNFQRVYDLAIGFDTNVAESVLAEFEPQIPLGPDGIALTLAGFFVGRGVGAIFLSGLAVFRPRRRKTA